MPECPNVKNKNGGLDQYGAGPFKQQQFGTPGVEMVKAYSNELRLVVVVYDANGLVHEKFINWADHRLY